MLHMFPKEAEIAAQHDKLSFGHNRISELSYIKKKHKQKGNNVEVGVSESSELSVL